MTDTSGPTPSTFPVPLTRRQVLVTNGLLLTAASVSSCDFLSTSPTGGGEQGNSRTAGASTEPPALASRVEHGELPPLADRIPHDPPVVETTKKTGRYGGQGQFYIETPTSSGPRRVAQHDYLMRWKADFSGVVPNVAGSVELERGGRTFVFHLRPGMKWSDGKPFTSADLDYAVNDVLLNDDLWPVPPEWLMSGGERVQLDTPDEYTVKFTFKHPRGLFLEQLARQPALTQQPRHYMKQFHKKYNPDAPKLAEESQFDAWTDFYLDRGNYTTNPDLPTIYAWQPKSAARPPRWVFKRNPYYWKVDEDGRQLPYIDEWAFNIIGNPEAALLKLSHGDIDLNLLKLRLVTLQNKPVLARNRDRGNYHFIDVQPGNINVMMLALNMVHKNEALREVLMNKDFRMGLSHAINRSELIELGLQGQGEPWQGAPRKEAEFFDEKLAKQYTEFEVATAERCLDRSGFTDRDDEGFRLTGDGSRIDIGVDVPTGVPYFVELLERIKEYWSAVGVSMSIKSESRSLFWERLSANLHDAMVYVGEAGTTFGSMMIPRWYFPFDQASGFAIPWVKWYVSGGNEGEKPPAEARRQMELYTEVKRTVDHKRQIQLFRDILRISREQFWVMGIALPHQAYGVVANDLHNVPENMSNDYTFLPPGPTSPEQYFFSEDEAGDRP